MGGTEINLMVAIDFTGSNGKPTDPNSLHAIGKGSLNGNGHSPFASLCTFSPLLPFHFGFSFTDPIRIRTSPYHVR